MSVDLKPKLIVVTDLNKLLLFKAEGIKITEQLKDISLKIHKEFSHERGTYQKASHPASAYEPHTSEADYQYKETANIIAQNITDFLNNGHVYGTIMLAAPAKLLGHIRHHLDSKIKSIISKELSKDLTHKDKTELEKSFFS